MRRLPVFFVIDVSESMVGEPILKVEEGMRSIISELKKDPYALETVYISIIVFAGKAKTILPLTELISFYPPKFSIGAGTSYGGALRHLINDIETSVNKTTIDSKGDWKPIVYFMTDGNATDDFTIDLGVWEQKWKTKTNAVVISIGDNSDQTILKRISNDVLAFDDTDPQAYGAFFKWVTSSIKTQSMKVEEGGNDSNIDMTGFDTSKLKKVEVADAFQSTDERYAIFRGVCQQNKRDYLLKYKKSANSIGFEGLQHLNVQNYRLEGSYMLDENYSDLSTKDSMASNASISIEDLWGAPHCPSCNNRFAMCICQCGGIFCVDGGGTHTCPHCKVTSEYGQGSGTFDIDRQQG